MFTVEETVFAKKKNGGLVAGLQRQFEEILQISM